MTDCPSSINQQYGRADLYGRNLDAFDPQDIDGETLTLDDLSRFDQLHDGGREATCLFANLAGPTSEMKVLDIRSGVGGPARTFLDINAVFNRTA